MRFMCKEIALANNYFELDLSSFDFSNVTYSTSMLSDYKSTQKIYVKNETERRWIINNSSNSNITTNNVLIKS